MGPRGSGGLTGSRSWWALLGATTHQVGEARVACALRPRDGGDAPGEGEAAAHDHGDGPWRDAQLLESPAARTATVLELTYGTSRERVIQGARIIQRYSCSDSVVACTRAHKCCRGL